MCVYVYMRKNLKDFESKYNFHCFVFFLFFSFSLSLFLSRSFLLVCVHSLTLFFSCMFI